MSQRDDRAAFRRRLGFTLGRVRTKLTDFTQASIAERLGVDTETVGRWERGDREPKVFDLHRLWQEYEAPGDWFLNPTDSVTELEDRIEGHRVERRRQAAAEAARADVEDQRRRPDGEGGEPPRGTSPKRTPPRSPH